MTTCFLDVPGPRDTTAVLDFLASSPWKPTEVNPGRSPAGARDDFDLEPRFRLQMSTAPADFGQAQQEAVEFLRLHEAELVRLRGLPGGVGLHLSLTTQKPADVLAWGVRIPVELSRLLAQHGIELSVYCDPRPPEAEPGPAPDRGGRWAWQMGSSPSRRGR